jgi:hypothetical protein
VDDPSPRRCCSIATPQPARRRKQAGKLQPPAIQRNGLSARGDGLTFCGSRLLKRRHGRSRPHSSHLRQPCELRHEEDPLRSIDAAIGKQLYGASAEAPTTKRLKVEHSIRFFLGDPHSGATLGIIWPSHLRFSFFARFERPQFSDSTPFINSICDSRPHCGEGLQRNLTRKRSRRRRTASKWCRSARCGFAGRR